MKLLIEKGAKVNRTDKTGATALTWAKRTGHGAVVKLLIENGAEARPAR